MGRKIKGACPLERSELCGGGENEGQMVYIVGGGRESRGRIDKTLKE